MRLVRGSWNHRACHGCRPTTQTQVTQQGRLGHTGLPPLIRSNSSLQVKTILVRISNLKADETRCLLLLKHGASLFTDVAAVSVSPAPGILIHWRRLLHRSTHEFPKSLNSFFRIDAHAGWDVTLAQNQIELCFCKISDFAKSE